METPTTITRPEQRAHTTLPNAGPPALPGASAKRPPVALVQGRTAATSADLARLLRKRLLLLAVIGTVINGFDRVLMVLIDWQFLVADPIGRILEFPIYLTGIVQFVVCAPLAVLLWTRTDYTLGALRWIEGVIFTVMVAQCVGWTWTAARLNLSYSAPIGGVLANSQILFWYSAIATYGIMIPNTAWRCLTVVSAMVLVCIVSVMGSWFYFGIRPERIPGATSNLLVWMGLVVALTVSGAHWFDQVRREAMEARRLGQYVLRQRLGVGGMGEVYLAEHLLLRRPAAIKLIRPEQAGNPNNLLRFEREVQMTALLTHPNTIQVFDYGHSEDGTFYYVMEYLPGHTLDQIVKEQGPLPPARAVHFLRQVCAALREAHAVGLIHRDIKPGNVMVCERGGIPDVAKLLDFGLVLPLHSDPADHKLTQEGGIAGTPAFMSPEQAGGEFLPDARSDIYSVGALAYFLLTGRSPFAGRSVIQMLAAHLYEPPQPLTAHRADVPADLEAVVLRCLAKSPADRFPDAASLEAALGESQR